MSATHVWTIRSPDGGAQGLEFARAEIDPADEVLVHAAPSAIDVEVHANGGLVARGTHLKATDDAPMSRLRLDGGTVLREELWPRDDQTGLVVILGGGEAGVLLRWWNDDQRTEWRWRLELSNRR